MSGGSLSDARRRRVPELDLVEEALLPDFSAPLQLLDDRPLFDGALVEAGVVGLGGVVAVLVHHRSWPNADVAVVGVTLERPFGILRPVLFEISAGGLKALSFEYVFPLVAQLRINF